MSNSLLSRSDAQLSKTKFDHFLNVCKAFDFQGQ